MTSTQLKIALILSINFLLILAGCRFTGHAKLADNLNNRIINSMDDSTYIRLLVATNRSTSSVFTQCSDDSFSAEFSDKLQYGSCEVNVPRRHTVGSLNTSSSPFASRHENFSTTDFNQLSEEDFFRGVENGEGSDEILLFIHGFNVPFQEAVFRAAQIAYDSKFQGTVVLFSWPAGSTTLFGNLRLDETYRINRQSALMTAPLFTHFIKQLANTDRSLSIIIHSMGHQLALPVLASLQRDSIKDRYISELILTAPDFSIDEFSELAENLAQSATRVTLYCSPDDKALVVSEKVNEGGRIGQCMNNEVIDVINVKDIDNETLGLGHGYYSGRSILTDIYQVLLGIEAKRRLFIVQSDDKEREDFILRN